MPRYSEERRQAVVAKLLPPHNLSPRVIAEQEGISLGTVYRWRKEARAGEPLSSLHRGGRRTGVRRDGLGGAGGRVRGASWPAQAVPALQDHYPGPADGRSAGAQGVAALAGVDEYPTATERACMKRQLLL